MGFLIVLQKPFGESLELQFLKQGHQRRHIGFLGFQFLFVELDRHFQINCGQGLRHQSLFGEVDDIFLLFAFQFIGMGNEVLYAAVFLHQLRCGLLPNARNAWNIVGGIAPKTEDVDELLGFLYAVAFAHLFRSPNLCWFSELGGFVEQNFVGHQLSEVLVWGHHVGDKALLFCFLRKCADDIVGLVAFHAVDGDVEGLNEPDDIRYGVAQVVGHLLAVGLVFAVFGLSLCGA